MGAGDDEAIPLGLSRAARLFGTAAHTAMTTASSDRPARCRTKRFTAPGPELAALPRPDYPIACDAGKSFHAATLAEELRAARARPHGSPRSGAGAKGERADRRNVR